MPAPLIRKTSPQAPLRTRLYGGVGTNIWGGQLDDWLDENAKTRGSRWYGEPGTIGEGQKMLADPHVRRARDALVDPVAGATWDFEPASKSALDREVADFCRFVFFECLPWTSFISQAMRAYIRDGFALFEQTDGPSDIPATRFRLHPGNGVGVVVTGLHFRPAWTIHGWGQSRKDPTKLDYVDQLVTGADQEEAGVYRLRSDRLIRFTWEQEGAHFEGHPILRSAWGPWMAKRMLMRIEMMSHERNHMPQPFIIPPENSDATKEELDKLLSMMSNFRAHEKGAFILPGGYSVDFKSGSANTPIQSTIDRLNYDIAMNVAAPFMLHGSKSTSSSYALANTQEGQFNINLDKHAHVVTNVFNIGLDGWSVVERVVKLNYGEVPTPRLVSRNMPTVNWQAVLPVLISAKKAGVIKADEELEKFFRRVTFAPELDERTRENYESAPLALDEESDDEEPDLGDEPEMAE